MISVSWVAWGLTALCLSQVIIFLVTLYFHRVCAHKSVDLHPRVHRVCRFLAWFLIAMDPKEFAAVHRKHHAKCDTSEDPHSPVNHGWHGVLFGGLALYRKEASNPETIEKYGKGLPVDPWETFYHKHKNLGIGLFATALTLALGWKGLLMWAMLMVWIPFWAAGVINGLGHHIGYRNYHTEDRSTNLLPWGVWVGGEELHNNHHAYPASAKFSQKWWEIDAGWGFIVLLRSLGWAQVRDVSDTANNGVAHLLRHRHEWLNKLHHALDESAQNLVQSKGFARWKHLSANFDRRHRLSRKRHAQLMHALSEPTLAKLHALEEELRDMWRVRGRATTEALDAWRNKAHACRLVSLSAFADSLTPQQKVHHSEVGTH